MTAPRRSPYKETIVSLAPAQPGWRALTVAGDEGGEAVWTDEVAVWALRETTSDGHRHVEGMVVGPFGLEGVENYGGQFLRYLAPGQEPTDFADEIAERQAELRKENRAGRAS